MQIAFTPRPDDIQVASFDGGGTFAAVFGLAKTHQFLAANDKTNLTTML